MSSYSRLRNSLRGEFPRERRGQVSALQKFFSFFFLFSHFNSTWHVISQKYRRARGRNIDVVSLVSAGFSAE